MVAGGVEVGVACVAWMCTAVVEAPSIEFLSRRPRVVLVGDHYRSVVTSGAGGDVAAVLNAKKKERKPIK